jgi:saccharopine dehydrogenase-like NADP-dependent oxidoreductase
MARIAIIGAGRVGTAAAKIFLMASDHELFVIDTSEDALQTLLEKCQDLQRPSHRAAFSPEVQVSLICTEPEDDLSSILSSIDVELVMCATPFTMNIEIATACARLGIHYIDFTEDVSVTEAISKLEVNSTFVPQTGLAPGLVNYLGLSLFEELGVPASLDLRVGALPQISWAPSHYAITWSPEGLINEYLKPAQRKVDGMFELVDPLSDPELLIVNGIQYEAFTTSGGVGMMSAYDHIPNVEYKTIRFPGHLAFVQSMFTTTERDFEKSVSLAKEVFERTRDDVVVLVAHAVDVSGMSASAGLHFYPANELDVTALELTTAGVGVGIAELVLNGDLPLGVLTSAQIPFEKFMQTEALRLVFDHVS